MENQQLYSIIGGLVLLALLFSVAWRYVDRAPENVESESEKPAREALPGRVKAVLKTNKGDITLELDGTSVPRTVENFVQLARKDFFDGTTFHRVIPDFMIQGGDPNSRDQLKRESHGTGGPGYMFPDELNDNKIARGSVAMANSGPNTNGSQFFIVTADAAPWLDGKHTNFGTVVSGMDVVDAISRVKRDGRDNPLDPVVIDDVTLEVLN